MCCRYYMEMSPELRPYVEAAGHSQLGLTMIEKLGKPMIKKGEVCPTNMVPVIAPNKNGQKSVFPMVWGFNIKGLDQPVINARVETAGEKKSFKDSWASHRCVIPASWYYEWEHFVSDNGKIKTGDKYAIQPSGSSVTYIAGLYKIEKYRDFTYPVFTILTRQSDESVKKIHDRMPFILPYSAIDEWIDPKTNALDMIKNSITDMVMEKV
ncbi:MAG: SOS response-associated peptidase [Lachnospiraceae bacterium]|nr:SOS response-associated peptidase [Lachnospiraceae bacterium]